MGSNTPTKRDLVWSAIIECGKDGGKFTVEKLNRKIYLDRDGPLPSDETVRRVLRAGADMGVISHTPGSQYYRLADDFTARRV